MIPADLIVMCSLIPIILMNITFFMQTHNFMGTFEHKNFIKPGRDAG